MFHQTLAQDTTETGSLSSLHSSLLSTELSLDNWLAKRALISPHQLALMYEEHSWTFSELYHLSVRYAYLLREEVTGTGIHSDEQTASTTPSTCGKAPNPPHPVPSHTQKNLPERIGLMCANSAAAYVSIMAMMNLGVQIVMLNTRLSAEELDYQIRDCGIAFLLCSREYADKAHDAINADPQQRTFDIRTIDLDELWECVTSTTSTTSVTSVTSVTESFPASLSSAEMASASRPEFSMNEVMSILYTSGTTGEPKGVMQTYGNHYWSATASMLNTGLESGDAWGAFTPLYHISGLSILLRSFIYGIPVCLYRKFDPARINADILSGRVTIVSVVAYALQKLLTDLGNRAYPVTFRYMLLGGGFFSDSLLEECERRDIPVIRSFGMSETCSQIIATPLRAGYIKPGSSGIALFPHRVRISAAGAAATSRDSASSSATPAAGDTVSIESMSSFSEYAHVHDGDGHWHLSEEQRSDGDGQTSPQKPLYASVSPEEICSIGEIGEIQIQSPALCCGYLNKEETYRASFTSDGWYKTGDIGYLDSDGYLYVKSRLAEMIISGGENIFPSEIEHCLVQHPAVGEAAVIGKPDSTWGYVPWAYITPSAPSQPSQPSFSAHKLPPNEELFAFLRQHLAGYKIPKRIVWLESLPKTSIGKIQKFKLLELDSKLGKPQEPCQPHKLDHS